jgi:hypothetical protein
VNRSGNHTFLGEDQASFAHDLLQAIQPQTHHAFTPVKLDESSPAYKRLVD